MKTCIAILALVTVTMAQPGRGGKGGGRNRSPCLCSNTAYTSCAAGLTMPPRPNEAEHEAMKACFETCIASATLSPMGAAMRQCMQSNPRPTCTPTGDGCSNGAPAVDFKEKIHSIMRDSTADRQAMRACKDQCRPQGLQRPQRPDQSTPSIFSCARQNQCHPSFCQPEKEAHGRAVCACLLASGQFPTLTC